MELATAPPAMPLSISGQVLPPSWVRQKCGFMSSRRRVLAAAYAVLVSKWPASMLKMRVQALIWGGVMLFHLAPPSVVTWMRPSPGPAQSNSKPGGGRGRDGGEGPLRRRGHGGGILAGVCGTLPCLAGEIAADGGPTVPAVGGLPHAGGAKEEHVGVLGRPDERLGADGAGGWFRRRGRRGGATPGAGSDAGLLGRATGLDRYFCAVEQGG